MIKGGIYRYDVRSRAFLERAGKALETFKSEGDVEQLLTAALMLRYGIEARLFEYIEVALPPATRQADLRKISEHAASDLLRKLTGLNPAATRQVTVRISPSDNPTAEIGFRYTPVTDSLARIHGKLGGLLHFNFFTRNPYWYATTRAQSPGKTVLYAQDLIEQGIVELNEATRGTLLAVPQWQPVVDQLLKETDVDTE